MVRPVALESATAARRVPLGTPVPGVKNASSGGASGGSIWPSLTTAQLSRHREPVGHLADTRLPHIPAAQATREF